MTAMRPDSDVARLQNAIRPYWSRMSDDKVRRYVGRFFTRTRTGTKIIAGVTGNHGDYTVSTALAAQGVPAPCSCTIGKHGGCHHCADYWIEQG